MFGPTDVVADSFGSLWVLERGNNRALRFDGLSSNAIQPIADAVLGQANFSSGSSGLAANRFDIGAQSKLFVEPSGNLWVCDGDNSRVLRFSRPVPAITPDTTRPKIKLRGRKTIETLRKRVVFRRTATDESGIAEIDVRTRRGAEVRRVRSGARWKVVLRVTKDRGRVVVKFRAVDDAGNRSRFTRARILRR